MQLPKLDPISSICPGHYYHLPSVLAAACRRAFPDFRAFRDFCAFGACHIFPHLPLPGLLWLFLNPVLVLLRVMSENSFLWCLLLLLFLLLRSSASGFEKNPRRIAHCLLPTCRAGNEAGSNLHSQLHPFLLPELPLKRATSRRAFASSCVTISAAPLF